MLFSLVLVYSDTKEVMMWIEGNPHAVHSIMPESEHIEEFIKTVMEDKTPVKIASHLPNTPVRDAEHWSDVLNGEATEYQSCLETSERPAVVCKSGSCTIPVRNFAGRISTTM